MADKNQPCWLTSIKTILYEIGMHDIYLNPAKCTRKIIKDLQTKLKSRYVQKWPQGFIYQVRHVNKFAEFKSINDMLLACNCREYLRQANLHNLS